MAIINTAINSEAFLIVISGVVIFALQKIISDLWIAPNLEFKRNLTKIETLLVRCKDMYKWTYKKSDLVSSSGLHIDKEIENLRKDINSQTWKLIESYNQLIFVEKWWLKLIGLDINKTKPLLLSLSVFICSEDDWKEKDGSSQSEKKIAEIYKTLKRKELFTEV